MPGYLFAFLLILISKNIFALMNEAEEDIAVYVKKKTLFHEFRIYMSETAKYRGCSVTHFELQTPTDKQLVAILYERLYSLDLNLLMRTCSVIYSEISRNTKISKGCHNFASYLGWYNTNLYSTKDYYAKNGLGHGIASGAEVTLRQVVNTLDKISQDLATLNTLFDTYGSDYKIALQKLSQIKGNNEENVETLFTLSEEGEEERIEELYNNIFEHLLNYFGNELLMVHNYFRRFLQLSKGPAVLPLLIPNIKQMLMLIQHYQPIIWGLEIEKSLTNAFVVLQLEAAIFNTMLNTKNVKVDALEESQWNLTPQLFSYSDFEFTVTESKHSE